MDVDTDSNPENYTLQMALLEHLKWMGGQITYTREEAIWLEDMKSKSLPNNHATYDECIDSSYEVIDMYRNEIRKGLYA